LNINNNSRLNNHVTLALTQTAPPAYRTYR